MDIPRHGWPESYSLQWRMLLFLRRTTELSWNRRSNEEAAPESPTAELSFRALSPNQALLYRKLREKFLSEQRLFSDPYFRAGGNPLLDAVDKLRYLKVMQEGIQLPTIVVVGDQSSGKSSVLESLAASTFPMAKAFARGCHSL
ncbi:hypothetical protein F0562_003728 [Nyssa sinensis]|uniref:Dynamin N-terminal domain-containing protein n=1 Tax=Nyssa sinensis TaxID=561372 RepID=A0A5J5BX08_9ASTE|nr:hypothetical protein F0562_003728 [Nyssa sinensis]